MEIWIIYAFLTAILTSLATLIEKKTLLNQHAAEFSTILSIFTLILSIPFFFLIDYSKLKLITLLILFMGSIIGASAFLLIAKSVRHMKIGDSNSLIALSPGLTSLFALIFLGEILTLKQTLGIIILIIGAFVLETKNKIEIRRTIKEFKNSKYIHFIFLALLLYSITALIDRVLLFRFNMQIEAFIAFVHIFLAFHFLTITYLFYDGTKGIKNGIKKSGKWVFIVAILVLGYRYFQSEAIKIADVGLVTSIKRTSTLFTVLIGREIFHENKDPNKYISVFIIIAGVLLITL